MHGHVNVKFVQVVVLIKEDKPMFMFTNWCTYLLVLESTKIYLKFTLK